MFYQDNQLLATSRHFSKDLHGCPNMGKAPPKIINFLCIYFLSVRLVCPTVMLFIECHIPVSSVVFALVYKSLNVSLAKFGVILPNLSLCCLIISYNIPSGFKYSLNVISSSFDLTPQAKYDHVCLCLLMFAWVVSHNWFLIHLFWIDPIIDSFDIFLFNHCLIPSKNLMNQFLLIKKIKQQQKRNDSRVIQPKSYQTILFLFDKKIWTKPLAIISTQCIFTYEELWKMKKVQVSVVLV